MTQRVPLVGLKIFIHSSGKVLNSAPGAYKILDQFAWETSEMEAVMVDVADGMDAGEAAENGSMRIQTK